MRTLITLGFFYLALFLRSQPYSHSDTSLWDSPLSPQQVLRNGVERVIIKRTGWCRVQCSTPSYQTLISSYNYDRYGYPISLSLQHCRGIQEFKSENTYSNGLLVHSALKQENLTYQTFEQSYNSHKLPDSCIWLSNGQEECATAYTYDSLLRIRKTNYYEASSGRSLSLRKEVEEFYNTDNMPVRNLWTSHYGAEWNKEIKAFDFQYRKKFRVGKVITRNEAQKKIKVVKTYYKGRYKKKIKVIYRHSEYYKPKEIQKVSRKKGKVIYREYKYYRIKRLIPYRKFIKRRVYDASSGLLLSTSSRRISRHRPNNRQLVEFSYSK